MMQQRTETRLFDKKGLSEVLSMSAATINRRLKDDQYFPKPKLICGKSYWTSEQIDRYIDFIQNDGYAN